MALLSNRDRREVWAEFMRESSNAHEPLELTKSELRAAVNAIDQWVQDNVAPFNAAIPLPARSALTAKQKARLFFAVAGRRWEVE